jgi:N-acetylmuramoyl-L-alanine amidase
MPWSSILINFRVWPTHNKTGSRKLDAILTCTFILGSASAILFSASSEEKRLSIYSNATSYSLPVTQRDAQEYVALLELLQRLGPVTAKLDGSRWKLRFNNSEVQFENARTRVRIRGQDLDLPTTFVLDNGRGFVSVSSLPILLPKLLERPVTFHEASRRLFLDNTAVHFTAQMNNAVPANLVINFTSPVNPIVATEPGKLRMVFQREPLVAPGSETLTFGNKVIPFATYSENNGAAEIAVSAAVPLFASFSNGGKTITIVPAPQASSQTVTQAPAQGPGPISRPAQTGANPNINPSPAHYFVVLDPSHGGSERGAALSDDLVEKTATLNFALRMRQEFETHGLTTLLVRNGDETLTPDQRGGIANRAHPAIYVCLHVSSEGTGIRLYTALVPAASESHGLFVDWNSAQAAFIDMSQSAAASVAAEFSKKRIPTRSLVAPLRPLNNITSAAVAVEVSPLTGGVSDLNSSGYQQQIAESVVAGILGVRAKLVAKP